MAEPTISSGRIRMFARALARISNEELEQLNQLIVDEGGQALSKSEPAKTTPKVQIHQPVKKEQPDE